MAEQTDFKTGQTVTFKVSVQLGSVQFSLFALYNPCNASQLN